MYLYLITNLINDKKYIGITNNPKKRWENHKCNNDPTMAIAKAIKKYGVENFKFEILLKNIPLNEIDDYEIEYIEKYESHVSTGKGYNISKGGRYNTEHLILCGADNGKALLAEEEAKYIKEHRDIPEYVLYEEFSEKIGYEAFKNIYLNKTYTNIECNMPEPYPYNNAFSCQFTKGDITYDDVVKMREMYKDGVYWKDAFKYFKHLYTNEMSFWQTYNGKSFKLIMPEVFTEENKHKHTLLRACPGDKNGRAKLTKKEVIQMRQWFESKEKTRKEIQEYFSDKVTSSMVNRILRYDAWKNV